MDAQMIELTTLGRSTAATRAKFIKDIPMKCLITGIRESKIKVIQLINYIYHIFSVLDDSCNVQVVMEFSYCKQ